MKQHKKVLAALAAALLASAASSAQTATTSTKKPVHRTAHHAARARRRTPVRRTAVHEPSATERRLTALNEQVATQQTEIDALRSQLSTSNQQAAQAQQSVADAQTQVATATAASVQATQQATQNAQDVQQLKGSVGDLETKNQSLTDTVIANQAQVQEQINSPTTLHYKGVNILPIGFFAFEGVWRQRSVNSDINTPFNTIPFPSATEGHVSELNFSGRQSRLGALFTGDAGTYHLAGYFEADFLGAGVTSNNNQSNSYVFRQRQIWGQGENAHGFRVTGGQMWSLVTENSRGTDNRTEVLPNTIDPQYMVGFNWTRQPAIRFQQRFGDPKTGTFTLAMSLEQAQITNFTAASATTGAVPTNFFFGGGGTNGGLYNAGASYNSASGAAGALATYANNVAPDVIVKGAFDFPHTHLELGGIARFLRDYYYPILTTTATNTNGTISESYTYGAHYQSDVAAAGGIFGAVRVAPVKPLEVAFQAMAGPGVGRYGSSQLADATLRPDGELEPIRNYHALASVVTHEGKKLDVYAYYGGEYDQRTVYTTATGATLGYGTRNLNDAGCYALPANPGTATGVAGTPGSPGTCASPTRYIQEGMVGFTYRIAQSPRYGRLQYQATYSYLQRNLWSGTTATPVANAPNPSPTGPRALDNMIHVSMRYYIP